MEASTNFNPNEPEPLPAGTLGCHCKDEYTVIPDQHGQKYYILRHGIMVAGPMNGHEVTDWLDKAGSNE